MPYKTEKMSIKNEALDKRVKLTLAQKEEIRNSVGLSQRELARKYGVSRRLIVFTLFPERLKENKVKRVERVGTTGYYKKEKQAIYMKKHRNYKNELYKKGLLHANT